MPAQGKKYLSISETAKFLGVSIDTIRRWDKNGSLASVRLDGKNRYFDTDQLKALKANKPLSISEAAATLGVSITTLRRLEARGLITPTRDANGERLYTKDSLDSYLENRTSSRKEAAQDSNQARMTNLNSTASVSGMTDAVSPSLANIPAQRSVLEESKGQSLAQSIPTLSGPTQPRETTNNIVKNEVGYSENQKVRVSDDQNIRHSDSLRSSDSPILRPYDSSDSLTDRVREHSNSPISSFFKPQAFAFMAPRLHRPTFAPAFSQNPMFKMAAGATAALFLISILSYSIVIGSKKETTVKTIVPKMEIAGAQVLASTSKALDGNIKFNVPALFGAPVRFSETIEVNGTSLFTEDVTVQDKNLTLGTGAFTSGTATITGLSTTGTLAVNGASNLNGTLDVEGPATFGNVINFGNLSTDPATGTNGAQYYNTTSNIFRCYVNGTWVNCDTDTTSGGTMSSFNIETNGSNSFSVGNGNTVDFIAGSNVTISTNTSDKSITISATGSTGGMTSFTLAGDTGTNQTISDASTLTVAGGNGISTVTSATGVVTANLDLFTGAGTTATTSSASGLEISSGALSLLRGCNDTQILSWNSGTQEWACTNGGGSSAIINVEEEGTPVGTNVTTLNFAGADFDLTTPVSSSTVYLQISSAIPRKANNETISGSWTYSSATPLTLSNTAPTIAIANTGTLTFSDGTNTLLSIADTGTSGRITTGNATLTALSSGAGTQLCINGSNQIVTCTSGSGGVTGSGTVNQIPKFTTTTNIGDSLLADDGTTLTYAGTGGMSLSGSGAPLTVTDNAWLGLGSSAGKIEFDDQTTDEVNILNANVGIGTSTPIAKLQTAASGNTLEGIFGSASPVVLQSNWGTVSFNSYNDGSGQKGYTGGGAYAGAIQLRANTGQLSFNMGGAVATAGDAVTMATVMMLSQNGNLMLGPGFADTYRLEVTGAAGTTRAASITGAGAKTAADYGAYIANTSTSSTNSINKYGTYITSTGTWNGTSANNYGLYVDTVSGGTNNYGAVFASGNVGVGDTSPTALFTVGSGDLFQVNSSGAIAAVTGYTQGSGVFSATLTTTNSATFGSTTSGSDIIALKPQTTGTANSFTGTITTGDLTGGNQTFTLPNLGAATSDTVCLLTLANCVGTGGGISGSGTTNTIPKFTSASSIGDSLVTDNGTTFAINTSMFTVTEANGNTAIAGTLDVAGHGAFGNNGSVVSGQVLTVDENSSITSGTIYGTLSAINANAAGSSTANYAGVRGGTNIITAQQYSSIYGVQGAAYALLASGASVTGSMVGVGSDVGSVNGITSGTIANLIGFENATQNAEDLTVTNSYGLYAKLGSVDAGAITNNYGIRVVDGTQGAGTIGTNYGLYINNIATGDSANYGIYVADAGTASLALASTDGDVASGITFGGDTVLYRSAADTLRTNDAFNVNGNFNVTSAGAISAATGITSSGTITFSGFTSNGGVLYTNGSGVLAQATAGTSTQCLLGGTTPSFGDCSSGGGISGSGTSGQIAFFNGTNSITSESSGFGWDTTNKLFTITSTATTQTAATITASSLTSGSGLSLVGPTATGIIGGSTGMLSIASDVGTGGSVGQLVYLAPDFSSTTNSQTAYGLRLAATDSTTSGTSKNDYGAYISLALTGDLAKTGYGTWSQVTTTSTTADTLYAYRGTASTNAAISTGTRSVTAFYADPAATGGDSGGTINVYGFRSSSSYAANSSGATINVYGGYFDASGIISGGGTSTINTYGVYVPDVFNNSGGTSAGYGIYVANQTGLDAAYGIYIADAANSSLYLASTDGDAASGITFGADTNLYRSAANTLKTDDNFTVNSKLTINTDGDMTSAFTTLDGSTTSNGTGTASTSLVVNSATNFNVGNYVQVSSTNCTSGVNVCYAKITNIAGTTFTISPALTWANGSAVVEVHVPEIGATNLASTLTNRYGRGYFIDGVVTGNGTTYYTDNNITIVDGETFNFTDGTNTLLSIIDGGTSGNLVAGRYNGLAITNNGTNTLDIAAGKTLTVSNTLTLTGTDGTSFALPASSGTICTVEAGNCAGSGTGVTTAGGTLNFLAKFSGSQAIANSLLSDNGTTLTYTGSGGATLGVASTTTGALTLYSSGNAFFTKFQNSASQTQDITYTLPVDDGSNNYVLSTNGSGTLSWVSVSGAGGISGSGTTNTIPKFTSSTAIGDSLVTDDGTTFAINTNMFTVTEASGNTTVAGTLAVNGAALTTDDTTFALLNGTATTVNAFGAATALNLGASGGLTLTPGGHVTVPLSNSKAWTYTSDLSGGARSADVLTISQANDASNSSTGNLLQLTNSDLTSTTALLDINNGATTDGARHIQISSTLNSISDHGLTFGSAQSGGKGIIWEFGISGGWGTYINGLSSSGIGHYTSVGALTSGKVIEVTGGVSGSFSAFTGSLVNVTFPRTLTSGSIDDTGNYLSLSRSNTVNNAGSTFTVSGDLASFTSNCTQTAGTCTDTGNILELTQSYASATGAVLNIVNAGTGNAIEIAGAGTRKINSTSGDLALATTTSGNITLTPSSATALVNVLTGNLKVGNGTPGQTLDGEDLYVEGLVEIDGAIYNDGLTSGTPTGSVCYDSSNKLIQCSGGSGLSGSGTSGQIAFFNGTNSITSETSGFGWDTTSKLFTLTSTATTQSAAAFVANSLTTGNVLSLSSTSTAGGGSGSSYLLNLSRSGTNSNATHTAYGIASAVTNTGTTSTNIAGYFSASGASNNYGIIVPNGGGYVGIGTSAPGALLELDAMTGTGTNAGMIIDADTADNAFIDFYEEGVQSANIFWNGSSNYLAINSLTNDTIISSANLSLVGIGTTNPARKLEINSLTGVNLRLTYADGDGSATNYSDFLMSSSGDLTIDSSGSDTNIAAGDNLNLVSGAGTFNQTFTGTTTDAFNITAASLTTGELMNLNATYAPTDGSTNEAIDINLTHAPTTSADTFAGIDITTGDATALGNTINNVSSVLNLSGNAAKTARGYSAFFTDTSTTADTLVGYFAQGGASGAISTGTRNIYGFSTNINSSAANTGGTTGLFGVYSTPTSTNATTGSTTNIYGGYFAPSAVLTTDGTLTSYGIQIANNATINTTGTTTQFGIDIAAITGADTNIGLRIVDAGTYSLQLASTDGDAASGITFGTDTNLYRSAANMLKTDDNLTIAGLTTGTPTGSVCYDSNNVLIQCSGGSGLSGSGTSGQIAFFNGTNSITSETSGFGWDTTNKLFTVTSTATTQTANSFSGTAFTTGELLDLTGTWATSDGSSNEAIDINLTHAPTGGADNFIGIDLTTTDATTLGNTIGNFSSTITLTGNAAKTPVGYFSNISSNSTTADTFFGYSSVASTTGIITTGTRSYYGYYSAPTAGAESTGGTTNVYGYYAIPSADVGAGGTVNSYGLFVNNGTFDTDGTSAAYGVNIEAITGADTNIGLRIADAGTYSLLLASTDGDVASGITFGSDTNLYRSAANVLSTNASILPTADDTYDLGDNTHRWANLFLGGETLHIGTSTADEAVLSYTTASNTLLLDNTAAGIINIGTTALAQAITVGNATGATALNLTTGTAGIAASSTATTGTGLALTTNSLTTGEAMDITAALSPTDGSTNEFIDLNFTNSPSTLANTTEGINLNIADSTALANTIYGINQTIALSGNAAKNASGFYSNITSSSTTADSLVNFVATGSVTGIITTGTRSVAGVYSTPLVGAESTGGTTNVYGFLSEVNADVGAGGTVNGYGFYFRNGTFDTDGTSTQYGIYLETPSGADTNYALYQAGGTSLLADGSLLNLANINVSSSTEGLYLPQTTSCASGTAEGQICWDTNDNTLWIGDGAAATQIGGSASVTWNGIADPTGNQALTFDDTEISTWTINSDTESVWTMNANSLTTGKILSLAHTTSVIANGGSLLKLSSTSADTGTTTGNLLDLSSSGSTAGSLMNIAASSASQTTTTALAITQSGVTTGYTGNFVNITGSSTTGSGTLLNLTSVATSAGTGLKITANSLTDGTAMSIGSTSTGLAAGSLLSISTGSTSSLSGAAVRITATADFSGHSNGGLLGIFADSTTAGFVENISADAMTTGRALNITSTSTGMTTGSLIFAESATTGAIATNGLVHFDAYGNYTSSSNVGLLQVQANATTGGTIQNIQGNALTTGTALRIASTGTNLTSGSLLSVSSATTNGVSSGIVSLTASGNYTSSSNAGLLNLFANSTAAGTAQGIFVDALTTGVGLSISSLGTGLTSGSLLSLSSATTGAISTGGVSIVASGAFTSSSNTGFVNINANTVATGNVQSIFAPSLTTGKAMYLSSTGTGMTSGSLLFATSGTTGAIATNGAVSFNATGAFTSTSNQGFLSVNANSTTAGTAESIFTNALTTGVGLYVTNSSSSSITTGSLIRAEAGGTGTIATNGVIQFRHGGNYASTSNMGFVGVQANSTTAGTIMSIDGNALTTGQGLRIASTGTGLTSGSLLFTTTATTGAMATNGAVSFNATGAFTSTSNMGFVNVNASATTAGTVHSIFADALTTGVGLYTSVDGITTGQGWSLNSTSTAFTSGKLQAIDWSPGSSTTATGDLLSINMGANALGANLLNLYNNGSSIFSVNQTQFTSAVPVNFTAAGDVSLAYDLNFTNATASYITSDAPLYLVAGETFNSSNLILQTYNNGAVVVDSALSLDSQITLTANSTTPSVAGGSHFTTANTTNPTLISNFTNGTDGQIIYIQLGDSVTDLDCTSSSINCGTTDMTNLASGDVVGLLYNGSKWNLISWMRNSADNSNPTNGVDLAEYFFSNEALVPGDVVSIDQAGTAFVRRSNVQYDNKAMGVIATQPGIILGPQAANTFPVALVGRVPVKVDPNSAPIREGDFLTASGTSGKAMKAQNPGQMLGRALEDWTPGSGQTTVLMFVNASYADPNRALANLRFDENGNLIVPTQDSNLPTQFTEEGWGQGSGSLSLDDFDADMVTGGSGTFANLFANVFNSTNQTVQNVLEAGEVVSNTLFNKSKDVKVELTDGLAVKSNNQTVFSVNKSGEASASAKISAPQISADQATIETLTVKNLIVENLMQNGASSSATVDFANQGLKADFGEFDIMTVSTDLSVAGTATLADVAVMNQIKFNNNLTINETSINTLATDLEIQPLKQGAISFMADAVRIETDGTVTFNENVAFKKDVEVAGVLSASTIKGSLDDVKISSASAATEITDTEVEASGAAGMVTLKAGEFSVKVNNPKVTEDSLIFITPKGTTYGKTLYIKNQIEGASFTVGVEGTTPAASNIKFNFLIVN